MNTVLLNGTLASRLVTYTLPYRVRYPTDPQFISGCSPPTFGVSGFPGPPYSDAVTFNYSPLIIEAELEPELIAVGGSVGSALVGGPFGEGGEMPPEVT